MLVVGNYGQDKVSIWIWDISNPLLPKQGPEIKIGGPSSIIEFSPDKKTMAVLDANGGDAYILLWNISNPLSPIQGSTIKFGSPVAIAFGPDNQTIGELDINGDIALWDISNMFSPIKISSLSGAPVSLSLVFSPNGNVLVSADDKSLTFWNMSGYRTPLIKAVLKGKSFVMDLAFTFDDKKLISRSSDGDLILWDISNTMNPQIAMHLEANSESIALSSNGYMLASLEGKNSVVVWDISNSSSPKKFTMINDSSNDITYLALSPDGKFLSMGGRLGSIELWNIANPNRPVKLSETQEYTGTVTMLSFNPSRKIMASAYTQILILWDISNPESPQIISKSYWPIYPFGWVFGLDGKTLLFTDGSNGITIADVSNPSKPSRCSSLYGKNRSVIASLAINSGYTNIASGSLDNKITLWDLSNSCSALISTTIQLDSSPYSLVFSKDGNTLASGEDNGDIILWDVDPKSWENKSCQIAGRNFTRAEWSQYFPDETYRATCPQWPIEPEPTPTPNP